MLKFRRLPLREPKTVEGSRRSRLQAPPWSDRWRCVRPELRDALANVRNRKRDTFVAPTVKGGPSSEFGLLNAFRRTCGMAGLEGWRLHDLRHFFVTDLFRRGAPAHALQALAGHADLATTQRYAPVAHPDLEAAIARLAHRNQPAGATGLKSG